MKPIVLALWAFVLAASVGLGFGVATAEAKPAAERASTSDKGDTAARAAVRGERRAVRHARASRHRATRHRYARSHAKQHRRTRAVASRSRVSGGSQSGIASYYWQGQRVASGGWFNPNAMTAAHRTLPFGTKVRVTNHSNGRAVTVTINDRGPFVGGRIIDLSRAAASAVGMTGAGLARVSLAIIGR